MIADSRTAPTRPTDQDEEQPGRPNTPRAALSAMLAIGLLTTIVLVLMPPYARALAQAPLGPDANLGQFIIDWVTVLYSHAAALANVVSAFAVLLLTLFIEESLKASDKVPVQTRRNLATFTFIGGIVTVTAVAIAVIGAFFGGDMGSAIQIVGSACVVLFFAAHIATRSVVSLQKQRHSLLRSRDILTVALQDIRRQRPLPYPAAVWTLAAAATLCVAVLPVAGFILAESLDRANSWTWVGGLFAAAYLTFGLFFLMSGTTPGNSTGIRVGARIAWVVLALMLAFTTFVAFALNSTGNVTLPLLFIPPALLALASAPTRKMPRWTLTGAARSLQLRSLTRAEKANERAIEELDAWEAKQSAAAAAVPGASLNPGAD